MSTQSTDGRTPIIETERLVLRGVRRDDFDAYAAMWADPHVTRFICGAPLPRESAWAKFLRDVGHWSVMGYGYWAIEERSWERSSGRWIGVVGFADFQRDIEPSIRGCAEIGYVLASAAAGNGFATEAARAAVAWAVEHLGPVRKVCLIHRDNAASLRVADKCGFREFARTTYNGQPTIVLSR